MKVSTAFNISDNEYWSDPWRSRKEIQRPFMQKGEEKLLIGSPKKVVINLRESFPVSLLHITKLMDTKLPVLNKNAIVIALNSLTHELKAIEFFSQDIFKPSIAAKPTKKDSFSNDETAMTSAGHTVDLFRRLGIDVGQGEYFINVITLDKISNRCKTKLVESADFEDTAVENYLKNTVISHLTPSFFNAVQGEPHVDYQLTTVSPDMPEKIGINASIERVNKIHSSVTCGLKLSFKLPVATNNSEDIISNIQKNANNTLQTDQQYKQSDLLITSLVPINILITGSVTAKPRVINLMVPSYEKVIDLDGEKIAKGHVSLDLNTFFPLSKTPQTYFIYIFSGELINGPIHTAFIHAPIKNIVAWDKQDRI